MYNQLSRYGAIAKALPFTPGKIFFVVKSTEAYYPDFQAMFPPDEDGEVRVFTDVATAYAATVSNRNDVIVLDGNGTHSVTALLAVAKNRVHFVGMDWLLGDRRITQQSSKIELSGAVAIAAVMKVTGVRNSFRGIKFIQSSTHASALNVVQFAGEGSCYENCSFVFGVVDNLDLTTATEALFGEDAGTFRECSFGTDVLLTSAARAVMTLDAITGASSADGAKSNRFRDCEWFVMSSDANAVLIKLADTAGAKFLNTWINPGLYAVVSSGGGGIAITNAIASAGSFVDGSLVFVRPTTANCTNGCAGTTDKVVVSGAPVFGAGTWEGGTPT